MMMERGEAMSGPQSHTRRAVLATTGAAAVAVFGGCATYDQNAPGDTNANPGGSGPSGSGNPSDGAASSQVLAQTSDVPVGGGKVFEQHKVVITQPQAGSFKAFSAVCTHQGCLVTEVKNATINCPCHGSKFKVADGSVATGPASRALKTVDIAVDGAEIRLA